MISSSNHTRVNFSSKTPAFILVFLLLIPSFLFLAPGLAYACSCITPGTPQEELEKATAVFSGIVTDITPPSELSFIGPTENSVFFDVSYMWKGPEAQSLTITTESSDAACGYQFTKGESYLVYADGDAFLPTVSLCSRTAGIADAETDVYSLNAIIAAQTDTVAETATSTPRDSITPPAGPTFRGGDAATITDTTSRDTMPKKTAPSQTEQKSFGTMIFIFLITGFSLVLYYIVKIKRHPKQP